MIEPAITKSSPSAKPGLERKLGLFDATMLVMGGIVGSGIFINPYVVARQVHTPGLILGAWIFGGIIGVGGAFIWAELAATLPEVGGQYAYLREAYHPAVAFLYDGYCCWLSRLAAWPWYRSLSLATFLSSPECAPKSGSWRQQPWPRLR